MPTTRKLIELFRAIAADDLDGAASIASQICQNEERKGHRPAARALRGALLKTGIAPKSSHAAPQTVQQNGTGFLGTGLVNLQADAPLSEVVLAPPARGELGAVVAEWTKRDQLRERGLCPRSKLLFHGPPGCGKSLTARALAHDLHMPIFLVRFDSVIGAYLGQTAIHLRQLFHFAETTPCILLLDELDALGKRRGNPLDVGELDRIVIALMQELEHSRPQGLIVATSNLAKNLDDALWRRFDLTVLFNAPPKSSLTAFCRKLATKFGVRLSRKVLHRAVAVASFAEAEAIIIAEARRQALAGK
jgi:AAA+ superfamily predicted ATPase